ncbi:MAG: type IV secretion system protein [Pseudomonadota bacterium]
MFPDVAIFAPAYVFIDGRLSAFVDQQQASVTAVVSGPLRAALVLYIVLYGFAILRGAISEPVIDFAIRAMKLIFIYALATTSAYGDFVTTPIFQTLPNELAQAVGGPSAATVGDAFDELVNKAGHLATRAAEKGTIFDPGPWVVAAVVFVVGALTSALGFGVVMVAKIALALLVAIGPIFIACALFDASRRFFFGWLSQGVNYLTLFALVLTLVQLVLDLFRSQWSSIGALDPLGAGLVFVALCILAGFFFLQMPVLAAGVAGGASAGLADFGRAVGSLGHGSQRDSAVRSAPRPTTAGAGAR